MKIATWNVERPTKNSKRIPEILDYLQKLDADILVLTETNEILNLGASYNFFYATKPQDDNNYKEGETRICIYSKYKTIGQIETFRSDTGICVNFDTPLGNIAVYGTVIGVTGNKGDSFKTDLELQLADFNRISKTNNLCICGDLNTSFSDNYYFTNEGRDKLNNAFDTLALLNLTANIPKNIDHIILPKKLLTNTKTFIGTWNQDIDKKLSDHMGVFAIIF